MNTFSIKFYDQKDFIVPNTIRNSTFHINKLLTIFQHQVHGNKGHTITSHNLEEYQKCLTHDSDYLITNIPQLAIGVLTADCLPIALADEKNKAIGIVHAGWRGTVGKIVINAINHMNELYKTEPEEIKIFFGPCALPCCYEVDKQFIDQLPRWSQQTLLNNHFSLPGCNEFLLHGIGISPEQIDKASCKCTICNDNFCSHRKNPRSKTRQMSIIWLH